MHRRIDEVRATIVKVYNKYNTWITFGAIIEYTTRGRGGEVKHKVLHMRDQQMSRHPLNKLYHASKIAPKHVLACIP